MIHRTNAPYWDVLVETGVVKPGIPADDPGMMTFKESMEATQSRQPEFVRNVLLFAMIIGAQDGQDTVPVYIFSRSSGELPFLL